MEKKFTINGIEIALKDFEIGPKGVSFNFEGKGYCFGVVSKVGGALILDDGQRFHANVGSPNKDGESIVMVKGREAKVSVAGRKITKSANHSSGLASPMPGKIFKILKDVGSEVKKGEPILILEAMKMEHPIRSDKDGKVKKIFFKAGELVQGGVSLAEVE